MKKASTQLASSTTSKININNNNMKKTTTMPCCSKVGRKRGPWSVEEDDKLSDYIKKQGEGQWRTLPKRAGLHRCGKSCRLRWMNYLRPNVKRGHISPDEEDLILRLHRLLGNRWSVIAGRIPGRTDNEIKNYWNTHLSKKLIRQGINPRTHKPFEDNKSPSSAKESISLVLPPHHQINSFSNPILNALEQPCNDHHLISSNPNNIFNALEPSNNKHNPSSNPNTVCALEKSGNDHRNSFSNPNLEATTHISSNHTLFSVDQSGYDYDAHHFKYDYNLINDNRIDLMNNVNDDYGLNHEGSNDDVLSSFLDSLMNEEMFDTTTQNQQQTLGFGAD